MRDVRSRPVAMVDLGMGSRDKDEILDLQLMWTSHVEVLLQVMQALRDKELFADATLICGNKRFEVHQFVLSTCSLYLETLFRSIPGDHPVLMFPDASPRAMEQLLDFMYLGQTDLTSPELEELLDLAEDLKIIGLIHATSNPENQSQVVKKEQLGQDKDTSTTTKTEEKINKKRRTTTSKKRPKKITVRKGRRSSINKRVVKAQVDINGGEGADNVDKRTSEVTAQETPKKTTEEKILQPKKENTSTKSINAKKSEETQDEQVLHVCKLCQQEFKSVKFYETHMKVHLKKCLLSCPECPFNTLSSAVMIQHINKHSVGKPYVCPHCLVRHPLLELHISHQKKNHPKMEVVVHKSPVIKLKEIVDTRLEFGNDPSLRYTNQSSWTPVSPGCLLRPVQQTCTENQTVPSHPSSNSMNCDTSSLSNAEAPNVMQDSVVKTEVSLHPKTVICNVTSLQTPTKTGSAVSSLPFSNVFTIPTSASSTNIEKVSRKRKLSTLEDKASSEGPSTSMSASNPNDVDTITLRKSPRLHREKS